MGCFCGSCADLDGIKPSNISTKSINSYLRENQENHKKIIEKGPLFAIYEVDKKQAEALPKSSLKVREWEGNEAELFFETDAIFLHSEKFQDRIFYSEINSYKILEIPGFDNCFVELVISSKIGNRAYFFILQRYRNIINKILDHNI